MTSMARNKSAAAPPPEPSAIAGLATKANALLDAALNEFLPIISDGSFYQRKIEDIPAGKTLLAQDKETQVAITSVVLDRLADIEARLNAVRSAHVGKESRPDWSPEWRELFNPRWVLAETLRGLLRRALPLPEKEIIRLIDWPLTASHSLSNHFYPLTGLAGVVENFAKATPIPAALESRLSEFQKRLREANVFDNQARQIADRLHAFV